MVIKMKDWNKYQSYKDRTPPWIRLHRSLLDNFEYQQMSADARSLLPMLWLLTSEDQDPVSGLLRIGYEKIAFRLRIPLSTVTATIQEIQTAGFLEMVENKAESQCDESVTKPYPIRNETVTPETETETETERARAKKVSLDALSLEHISDWLSQKRKEGKYLHHNEREVLEGFKDYCRSKRKRYDDYPAALRNAFTWERFEPKFSPKPREPKANVVTL